jgi:ent-kaurene oxidase
MYKTADNYIDSLVGPINEEASYWLAQRIPGKTQVKAYDTMVRIIAATGSRMLGGQAVSRNTEWLETAALYSMDVVSVAVMLRPYPAFLRPLIAPWLAGTRTLKRHLETAKRTFGPMIAQRLAKKQQNQLDPIHESEKPVDMVQWMVDSARGSDQDPEVLSHNMLFMSLAAVHTSAATTIHALFDLCANPEYIQPIRDEVTLVIAKHGWTLSAIASMKKLDSFMKESQRLNQAVLMTFNRKVARPLRFEDGTTLPAGTYITMPSDSVARDPDIYENPEHFDGYRFYDRRMEGGKNANRHQFASTGPESLAFGQGKNACPGRFFAGVQIKVVLANILLNYDISYPPGQTQRPKNLYKGGLVRPDPRQKLLFAPRNNFQ